MAEKITFMPEDLSSVMSIQDLMVFLMPIIQEARQGGSAHLNLLITEIKNLESLAEQGLNTNSSLLLLYQVYHKIQDISLLLRSKLSSFTTLEVYDKISYSLYYQGTRYATDNLDISWLQKSSSGTLLLNLDKAQQDLKKELNSNAYSTLQKMIQAHLNRYTDMILGTYKGQTGKINRGHIAEAFESHLAEHHGDIYFVLNNTDNVLEDPSITKMSQVQFDQYWANHEDPTSGWIHIRGSLGTQRGTVAGDVGNRQVKSTQYSGGFSKVRLASLNNLKEGVKRYSDILNPNISIEMVSYNLAVYLSEPVTSLSVAMLNDRVNQEDIKIAYDQIEEWFKKNHKINRMIHI